MKKYLCANCSTSTSFRKDKKRESCRAIIVAKSAHDRSITTLDFQTIIIKMAPQAASTNLPNRPAAATTTNGNCTVITVPSGEEQQQQQQRGNLSYIPPVILPIEIGSHKKDPNLGEPQLAPAISSEESDFSSDSEDDDEEDDGSVHSQASIVEAGSSDGTSSSISGSPTPSEKHSGLPISKRSCWRKYRGMMLAIVSSFIFAVSALLVKKMETYDPFNSALYKFQGALLPAIPLLLQKYYCSKKGPKVVENVWPLTDKKKMKTFGLVLLRSFLTCNALLLHFFSLKYLPIGDALTISSASPIFVAILAKIFLGEKCGYSTIIASVCSLLGVVAIAKPPVLSGSESFDANTLIGTGLAFGCTVVTACSFITLRYIRKVHYSVTTLMYGAWGSIENLAIVLLLPGLIVPQSVAEWGLIIGLAALTLFGQFAIILAMKAEQAGPVALVRTFDVLFAFLFEILVWKKLPDMWSFIGATVIVLSVIFVGLRKWVRSFPRGHPIRRKLKFIVW